MLRSSQDLSIEQLRDLADAQVIIKGLLEYDPAYFDYFDDMDKYGKALVSLGEDPAVTIPHELSHVRCALVVGAIGVRYGIEYTHHDIQGEHFRNARRAVTSILGPSKIPRLGLAAMWAAPMNPSPGDMAHMRRLGYSSVEYLEERITKWNYQDTGLIIPMPGTIDVSLGELGLTSPARMYHAYGH